MWTKGEPMKNSRSRMKEIFKIKIGQGGEIVYYRGKNFPALLENLEISNKAGIKANISYLFSTLNNYYYFTDKQEISRGPVLFTSNNSIRFYNRVNLFPKFIPNQ